MAALSTYMADARDRPLPAEVVEKRQAPRARHVRRDDLRRGAAAGPRGASLCPRHGGAESRRSSASDLLCGPIEAALANGVLAHADETDDSHAPSHSHPGCAVVPAALAVGEQLGIDGAHFLRAVALGYDVGPRVTMALGGSTFRARARSTHSIAGVFGAAAAAGCAAGSRRAADALAARLYRAAVLRHRRLAARHRPHREGASSSAACRRATASPRRCWCTPAGTGVDDVFSGRRQLPLANAPNAMPALLVDKLGERYEVTRTNIKKWTVGSPIQAPLDALEILRKRQPFDADEVEQVVVRLAHQRGASRGQPRHPRHLPAAHGRRHADRQDRLVRCGARRTADCGTRRCCASARR